MPETVLAAGEYTQDEAEADAAITPGHMVNETGTGVAVHGTAAEANPQVLFAREFSEVGRGIDDDYAAGDNAKYIRPYTGARVRARLASGNTYTGGDTELVSAGDGTLRPLDTAGGDPRTAVVAVAYEDADTTDGNVGLGQVRVE